MLGWSLTPIAHARLHQRPAPAASAAAAAKPKPVAKPADDAGAAAVSTLSDEQVEERGLAFAPESLWQGLSDANWKTRLQGAASPPATVPHAARL